MFLQEEKPLYDYPYPPNSQPKNNGYFSPSDWRDAVINGQSWDAIKVGEMELSSLQVSASLQGRELWDRFGDLETEMLITKTGRRMFPSCKVTVTGLNPEANYVLMMDMAPFDDNKYKWTKDRWEVSGRTEPCLPNRFFIHPDSPSLGERWMRYPVSFHKLKLTNNTLNSNGLVILHSMHKYQPRLHIIQSPKAFTPRAGGYLCFSFPEAAFIAVTAYQNPEITKLKIDNNPFAKGFRDSGLSRKRFRVQKMSCCTQEQDRRQTIPLKPPHGNPDCEGTGTVPSLIDLYAADSSSDDTSFPAVPNPFISAFMNREPTALPCGQKTWPRNSPNPQPTTTRAFSSPGKGTRQTNVAFPHFTHTTLGQTPTGSVGLTKNAHQRSRDGGKLHYGGPGDTDLSHHHIPDHRNHLHSQHHEFDFPVPLPPKVSRMHLPESTLRSLEMSPLCSPCSPQPLTDILNRIHSRTASGNPGIQAQYDRSSLGMDRKHWPQHYPQPPPSSGHGGDCLPPHSMMLPQNNCLDDVPSPRAPCPSVEYSYKAPVIDVYYQNVKLGPDSS